MTSWILHTLSEIGIEVRVENGELVLTGNTGELQAWDLAEIRKVKSEILAAVRHKDVA